MKCYSSMSLLGSPLSSIRIISFCALTEDKYHVFLPSFSYFLSPLFLPPCTFGVPYNSCNTLFNLLFKTSSLRPFSSLTLSSICHTSIPSLSCMICLNMWIPACISAVQPPTPPPPSQDSSPVVFLRAGMVGKSGRSRDS